MASTERVTLPENLKINQAQALHDVFENLIQTSDLESIEIDANAVKSADTAGMQLVLALVKAARERHIDFKWSGSSSCFESSVDTLGLRQALELN